MCSFYIFRHTTEYQWTENISTFCIQEIKVKLNHACMHACTQAHASTHTHTQAYPLRPACKAMTCSDSKQSISWNKARWKTEFTSALKMICKNDACSCTDSLWHWVHYQVHFFCCESSCKNYSHMAHLYNSFQFIPLSLGVLNWQEVDCCPC